MIVQRLPSNPIIHPGMDQLMGTNINGPSLIRVPDWIPNPLGRYYLYFAHHQGKFIRLAYADQLSGPWHIYTPGTLQLDQTPCRHHIASPDVHIDPLNRRLIMYYHGPMRNPQEDGLNQQFPIVFNQRSFAAVSPDGIHFTSRTEVLGSSYFRVFRWQDHVYALGMPGIFYRSKDGFTNFEAGPVLFNKDMRHSAVRVRDNSLQVFYSVVGDCPEHIVCSEIDLTPDWLNWRESAPVSVIKPEMDYEGGDLELIPSKRGGILQRARQLRDPAIFEEDGRTYLLYSVAGENGIAMAEVFSHV